MIVVVLIFRVEKKEIVQPFLADIKQLNGLSFSSSSSSSSTSPSSSPANSSITTVFLLHIFFFNKFNTITKMHRDTYI